MAFHLQRHIDPACPACGARSFGLRVIRDEGLALARCLACNRDYLLFDSEDYWFDVIQSGYPRPTRCSCKGTSFTIGVDFRFRDDGDVRSIDLMGTCTSCGKTKKLLNVEIDYGGTEDLVTRPLRYCKNPKVRYDLKDLSLYLTRSDMAEVVRFMHSTLRCSAITWLRENGKWVKRFLDEAGTTAVVLAADDSKQSTGYIRIYILPRPLEVPDSEIDTSRKEASFWKQQEIIRISSPSYMNIGSAKGLQYYIQFANEFVSGEKVTQKSLEFRQTTGNLLDWLGEAFVSWRGPFCFDNPEENVRLFGDRFAKGRWRGNPH